MRVAFVGVKRKFSEMSEDYHESFVKYHLELPWYFARSGMCVDVTADVGLPDLGAYGDSWKDTKGSVELVLEDEFHDLKGYDVVVHWRKWFPEFYRPEAINVINCQDHSFGPEWKTNVARAFLEGKLYGVLCFPTWHKRNLLRECPWLPEDRAIDGLTLGVDTDVYAPAEDKDPYQMLWASDPGRGLEQAIHLAVKMFTLDSRFRLNVCYPDYCPPQNKIAHPAIVWRGNVPNGPELQRLFNHCGVLPYPTTFMEPSSRAHRQAMAAGSLVLYPPGRGSPSELIEDGRTGIVSDPATWALTISKLVRTGEWKDYGSRAREYAVSENWSVQAARFKAYFEGVKERR